MAVLRQCDPPSKAERLCNFIYANTLVVCARFVKLGSLRASAIARGAGPDTFVSEKNSMPSLISKTAMCLALALGLATSAAVAADGDPAAGRVKSESCLGCHGIEGYRNAYPSYRVPRVGGQSETYLVAALKAYRSGDRSHPTMQAQGASLSDEDIADIAAYLSAAGGVQP